MISPKSALFASALTISLGCAASAGTQASRTRPAGPVSPAPMPPSDVPADPEAASLESRAAAYWNRRAAKDLAGAYAFYCSSYKTRVQQAEFLQLTRLVRFDLRDVRVVRVEERADRAQVTISYRFIMPVISIEPIDGQSTDWWARDSDRVWCKEDEPLVLPFPQSTGPSSSGS